MIPPRIAPPERNRKFDGVEREHHHPRFLTKAERFHSAREAAGLRLQFAVSQRVIAFFERDLVSAPCRDICVNEIARRVVCTPLRNRSQIDHSTRSLAPRPNVEVIAASSL